MARNYNALQAILASVGGGLSGQAAQRTREEEQRRQAERDLYDQRRDAEASKRQTLLDAVALAEKGYVEAGERKATVGRAGPALGTAISNATAAMDGRSVQPVDTAPIMAAAGQYGATPASSVTLGDKTFERMQTPAQAAFMADEQERGAKRYDTDLTDRTKRMDAATASAEKKAAIAGAFPKLTPAEVDAVALGQAKPQDFPAYAPAREGRSLTPAQSLDRQDEMAEAEAWFNSPQDSGTKAWIERTFANMRKGNPTRPARDIILSLYNARGGALKAENTEAQIGQREAAAEAARARASTIGKNPVGSLAELKAAAEARRAGTATAPAGDKDSQRADRWDAIKAANPNLSDAEITARVMREIP